MNGYIRKLFVEPFDHLCDSIIKGTTIKNRNIMQNPLIQPFNTPHQTPPFDLIKEDHYKPAFELAIKQGRDEIDAIVRSHLPPTFENTIEALDFAGIKLGEVSNIFFNLHHAHTNASMQQIAREVSPWLTEFSNDIWLNPILFERVKKVYDTTNRAQLAPDQTKLLNDTYRSFVRKGALLPDGDKERYRQITTELSDLSLQFGENVLAETNAFKLHLTNPDEIDGLPAATVEAARTAAQQENLEGWLFSLHFPSYMPFMKYATQRELRKKMFMAYSSRGNADNPHNNHRIVARIAELRLEKAKLLGFDTHADYVLEERMAKSATKVDAFLNELLNASWPHAEQDVAEVQQLASSKGLEGMLERWDFAFYSEMLKTEKYDVDDELTKPYFQLTNVETGVFGLAHKLFGLRFEPSNQIPVYHPDVKAFEVHDADGSFLAVLYIDYFPRPSKQNGAWMTSFREQYLAQGREVRPVVSLVMNFTSPTGSSPSLLTFHEVRTFLHEFGHALHGMLSKVRYLSQSGTNVYRDFVELPSQWLENWATDKEWLKQTAIHYQTGQPIPNELIDKLIASDNFQSGYATVRQLSFGLLDMAYHTIRQPLKSGIVDFERRAIAPTELFPLVDGICTSTAFSHIFNGGYAAGYYGYKWAEVLDADAFELFKLKGTYHRDTANSFRTNILEKGGSAHPMDLYLAFRGQEPSIEPLLKRCGLKG